MKLMMARLTDMKWSNQQDGKERTMFADHEGVQRSTALGTSWTAMLPFYFLLVGCEWMDCEEYHN
jgi:hypothetical protein